MSKKYKYAIGLDPGVNTGIAVWDCEKKRFDLIATLKIHEAMNYINLIDNSYTFKVIVEDARKATFGRNNEKDFHKAQGAGSVKRDCKIWEDFLTDLGFDFEMKRPRKSITKLSSESFKILTKWEGRTSSHSRDSALLVIGM